MADTTSYRSKFDQYSELNNKFLAAVDGKVAATLGEPERYLIRQAYMEGFVDGQGYVMNKMMDKHYEEVH